MKRFLRTITPALKVFLLVSLFFASTYNQFVGTARAFESGSSDYCEMYPEDPQCGDPCDDSAGPPPPDCFTFCELYPQDPACVEDPCFGSNPPSSCECDGAYGPPPPECSDPCSGMMGPPPPECFDPCSGMMGPPPPECSDPCSGNMGPPPPECNTQYFCDDPTYCDGEVPNNYAPEHRGEPGWEVDNETCDCGTQYFCDDPTYCDGEVPINYAPEHRNEEGWEPDNTTCECDTQYFCDDPVYCDGDEPNNYAPEHRNEEGWEVDNETCECDPKYFCDDNAYCDGQPACNYQPEKRGVNPWEADNTLCECEGYCPEPDDTNYVDPSTLTCPREDYGLCSVVFGCMDSTAHNYDADAEEDDGSCMYLKSSTCSYEVAFEVDKINSLTGRIRNYAVGVLQVVVVSYLSSDPNAPDPSCPPLDEQAFTASHFAFIYDFLFPNWPSFSYSAVSYLNLGETEDFCANLDGVQNEVPAGYVQSGVDCIPDDICTQQGCQIINGICTCIDMCPNIVGNQTSIPAGYFLDGSGNCVTGEECTENGCSLINGVCRCPIDGNCSVYNPNPSGAEPSGLLCTAGSPSEISLSSHSWDYTCQGLWGGSSESCSVGMMCPGGKYCATNPVSTQCIDNSMCCDGFVMCPNGQCRPGTLANCVDIDLDCDTTVSPPMCARGGSIIQGLRMTPPVSDIDTNSCAISWGVEAAGGSVSCALTRDGSAVQSYGPTTVNQSYNRSVEPGRYEVACERLSTEIATDAEGVESTYILKIQDEQSMSCVQNPNYIEF